MIKELRTHKSLLPVVLLALLCQWTLWDTFEGILKSGIETLGFRLTIRQLLAIGLTIACIAGYFYVRRYYRLVLFVTLFTGLLNVVNFTPWEMYVGVRIWFVLPLSLHPLVAIAALMTFVQVMHRKPETNGGPVLNDGALQDFKERYSAYDTGRLQEIVNEARYVPEAIEAAKQVLLERVTPGEEIV